MASTLKQGGFFGWLTVILPCSVQVLVCRSKYICLFLCLQLKMRALHLHYVSVGTAFQVWGKVDVAALVRGFSLFGHLLICRNFKSHFKNLSSHLAPKELHSRGKCQAGWRLLTHQWHGWCPSICWSHDEVTFAHETNKFLWPHDALFVRSVKKGMEHCAMVKIPLPALNLLFPSSDLRSYGKFSGSFMIFSLNFPFFYLFL